MSETLTYDAGTDTVSTEENLTEDEQESLEIGEKMEAQEEQLLAGKYKNAEELEKAHIELQKKMGEKSSEDTEEEEEEFEEEEEESEIDEEDSDGTIIDRVFEAGTNNELTDELLQELGNTSKQDLATLALEYKNQSLQSEAEVLTEDDAQRIRDSIGGDDSYNNMIEWAGNNLPEEDVNMFDAAIDKGDPLTCFFATQALAYRYQDSVGRDGEMITGKAPKSTGDVFNSQAEIIKAMEDERYDDDPAYRESIMQKIARSNIEF